MNTDRLVDWRHLQFLTPTVLALWLASPFAADASDCSWSSPEPSWNHYFDGRLGSNDTVRLVLTYDDCSAKGTWFDSLLYEDLSVRGVLSASDTVRLTLQDSAGKVLATLRGKIEAQQGNITGTLSGSDRYNGQRVTLKLERFGTGTDAEVAAAVGITDQAAFDRQTLKFWRGVRDHNPKVVSECIRYPLTVTIFSKDQPPRSITVSDAGMLERDYDEIFNMYRRDAILSHLPRHMIWGRLVHTVELVGGWVLFDAKGRVISLS